MALTKSAVKDEVSVAEKTGEKLDDKNGSKILGGISGNVCIYRAFLCGYLGLDLVYYCYLNFKVSV